MQTLRIMWNWRVAFASLAAVVMLAPAAAMVFTGEVNWGVEDFVAAALLLLFVWIGLEVVPLVLETQRARLIGSLGVVLAVLTVWAQLAVGIF